jgi:hypothetical protein
MRVYYDGMKKHLLPIAWTLSVVTATLAILTWYQHLPSSLEHLSIYNIFPVFGLIAFSLMWCHYIVGALRKYYDVDRKVTAVYFKITAAIVLVAILLHPGLLTWQLWRDQIGLPVDYVAPDFRLYVIIGEIAWVAFLAFELHRFYRQRSWWHYVQRASDVAMILILIHAFNLGTSLVSGWFKILWIFYGLTLITAITYDTYQRHKTTKKWL